MASRPSKECGAETRDGGRCRRPSLGDSVCRLHAGRPSDREDGPSRRGGGYSEDLRPRLRAAYESALAVQGPLLRRDDVALLHVILEQKLAELDRATTSPDLDDVVARAERIASGWRTWDWSRMERELAAFKDALVGRRDRRDEVMREVRELMREKATLVAQVEAEDRLHAEFVPIESVVLLVRTLRSILAKHVRDPKALNAIEAGFRSALEKADDDRMKGKMKGRSKRAKS